MDLIVLSALAAGFVFLFSVVKTAIKIWWMPLRMKKYFESQGISGPPYRLLYGNTMEVIQMMNEANSVPMELSTHNILPRVLPEIHHWTKAYGKNFVYWFGPVPRIVIPQPELIRELLCQKFENYGKPEPIFQLRQLSGDGLVNSQGEKWARQRRLLGSAFHAEALKSFHCGKGRAYLFNTVVNVYAGPLEERLMTTGLHTVADIFCNCCGQIVGWKYEVAHEKNQKYKEGKFILERARMIDGDGTNFAIETNKVGSDADDV